MALPAPASSGRDRAARCGGPRTAWRGRLIPLLAGVAFVTCGSDDGPGPIEPRQPDPGSVSGRLSRAETGAALTERQVTLLRDGNRVATTTTGATGQYAFEDIEAGSYVVVVDSSGLPLFGRFEEGASRPLSVEAGAASHLDFVYRLARITLRVIASGSASPAMIRLELDASEIPLPLATLGASVTWPSSVGHFDAGSEQGAGWDYLLANESPPGTLTLAAISASGMAGPVGDVTFAVVATGGGSAVFAPTLTTLDAIDPATGQTLDLLDITVQTEEAATVGFP